MNSGAQSLVPASPQCLLIPPHARAGCHPSTCRSPPCSRRRRSNPVLCLLPSYWLQRPRLMGCWEGLDQVLSSKTRSWSMARISLMSPDSTITPCPRATTGKHHGRSSTATPKLPGSRMEPAGFLETTTSSGCSASRAESS